MSSILIIGIMIGLFLGIVTRRKQLGLGWCKYGLHLWKKAPFDRGFQKCARCGRWRAYLAHGYEMKYWWDLLEEGIDFDVYGNIGGSPKDTGLTFLPDVKYHSSKQISKGVEV